MYILFQLSDANKKSAIKHNGLKIFLKKCQRLGLTIYLKYVTGYMLVGWSFFVVVKTNISILNGQNISIDV